MMKLGAKALSVIVSVVLVVGLCPGLAIANPVESYGGQSGDAPVVASGADLAAADIEIGIQTELTTQAVSRFTTADVMRVVPKTYSGSGQCQGYAKYIGKQLTGVEPCGAALDGYGNRVNANSGWTKYTSIAAAGGLCVGDMIRIPTPQGGHAAVVTSVGSGSNPVIQVTEKWGTNTAIKNGNLNGNSNLRTQNQISNYGIYYILRWTKNPPTPTAKAPSIIPHDVLGGKKIELKDNQGGASIRYTTDGKTNPSNSVGTVYDGNWIVDDWSTMGVRAIAYKSGMNNSSITGLTNYNNKTATPTLEKVDMPNGATIVLDAPGNGETVYYTTDGSDPSFNVSNGQATGTKYTGSFTLTQNATVKAIAVRSGELVSDKLTQAVEVVPPAAPSTVIALNGTMPASKIAVDDAVTVRWNADNAASSYIATLYNEQGEVVETSTVKAAQAVFTPSKAGKYSVGVKAVNTVGASAESERDNFEAMAPCLVNFVDKVTDDQGNVTTKVLDKQIVRYGYSAENPAVPVKRGYTFAGWDKDTPLTNITENGYEIRATWQINSYTVRFYNDDGRTLINSQSVDYGSAATPPTPPAPEAGYVFTGWSVTEAAESDSVRDYNNVDSNMSLKAVYAWADQELPVVVSINSAKRNERVYTVDVNVKNNPTQATTAILRVSLKTSAGKLVQSARETISLPAAGATTNHVVSLRYEDGGYIASKAEVEVVGFSSDNRTGGAYSEAVTADVVNEEEYELATSASEWTTVRPAESADYIIESETQYRYQDKQTTTSTNASLEGWTREGEPVTTYGNWSGNQTTTSKPTASDTLQIKGQSTKYNWYHWCSYYDNCWNHDSCWVNSSSVKHTTSTTYDLAYANKSWGDKGGKASSMRGPHSSCAHHTAGHTYWWLESTVTTYTYQTRSKTITYGYYKWGDWSEWSNESVVSSDTRNVEERTVYRTRAKVYNDLTGTEDTSGETYTISGKFDSSLQVAGKQATIMVYNVTNSDPNEDQIQYIGQTTIGADNSYSFSFIPKKAPSAETGDFIVSLGVKGSTGLVNVDKIDAPANEHTVIYLYKNAAGEDVKVSEQQVADGQNAEVPDPPSVEGSQFQRWSASTTSVTSDMTVSALYTTATYAVAWVDWVNGGVFLETKAHGETLVPPIEDPSANGYTFKGWDVLLDGRTTVTGNTVVNAVYDPIKYSVVFANAQGGVFAKQEVAYGEAANPPAVGPEAEGMVFVSWDTSAGTPWWNVTEDMIVRPKYAYEETASMPYPTVEIDEGFTGVFGKRLQLESSTEGSTIFYKVEKTGMTTSGVLTTQGSDEAVEVVEEWFEYDGDNGIVVTEPCMITAVAAKAGMNDSTPFTIDVNVTATNNIANAEAGVAEAPFFFGDPVEPGVMVWLGDELLVYGEDYTVEYSDNTALGTGHALVKDKGNYTGSQLVSFDIVEPPSDEAGNEDGGDDPDDSGSGSEGQPGGTSSPDDGGDPSGDGSGESGQPSASDGPEEGSATPGSSSGDEGDAGQPAKDDPATYAGKATAAGFSDLAAGAWYMSEGFKDDSGKVVATYLDYTIGRGLMSGYTGERAGQFGPDDALSRGMAATIIYRMATGATAATTDNAVDAGFADVARGEWYAAAVKWCAEKGVVTGYAGTGRFGPDDRVTREQLAAMVFRYCTKVAGMAPAGEDVSRFPDGALIAEWARAAAAFCAANGIITGRSDTGAFDPQGDATRCQMAKIIAVTARLAG